MTCAELTDLLSKTDAANGFSNRFLWPCVRRSKLLPLPVPQPDLIDIAHHVADAVSAARIGGAIGFADDAADHWRDEYARLTTFKAPGLFGSVISRSEAHVVKLALIFALLGQRRSICRDHLEAALAVWDYAERSARFVFGDALGNADAERLLSAIKAAPEGLSMTEVSKIFSGHKDAAAVQKMLSMLIRSCLIRESVEQTSGRPRKRFVHMSTLPPSAK